MRYPKITKATFLERPNRFIAIVLVDGKKETVHVKNTGRCKELLVPGATVYLEDFDGRMGTRKLRYSLVAVKKQREPSETPLLINMDSQAPNALIKENFAEWAKKTGGTFKPECTYKNSRFDFWFQLPGDKLCSKNEGQPDFQDQSASQGQFSSKPVQGFLEVKGVTLENKGFCRFPDAPTERGTKHLTELIDARKNGFWAGVLFLVQMEGMKSFSPNDETDAEFGKALRQAKAAGVEILCYQCKVTPDSLELGSEVKVVL